MLDVRWPYAQQLITVCTMLEQTLFTYLGCSIWSNVRRYLSSLSLQFQLLRGDLLKPRTLTVPLTINIYINCAVYFQVPVWFDFKPHCCKINFVAPPEVRVPDLDSIYTQTFYQQCDLVGSSRYRLVPVTCDSYRHHSVLKFTADYNCSACTKFSMYNLHITSLTNLFSEKNY